MPANGKWDLIQRLKGYFHFDGHWKVLRYGAGEGGRRVEKGGEERLDRSCEKWRSVA
jgi:hypothetical protein